MAEAAQNTVGKFKVQAIRKLVDAEGEHIEIGHVQGRQRRDTAFRQPMKDRGVIGQDSEGLCYLIDEPCMWYLMQQPEEDWPLYKNHKESKVGMALLDVGTGLTKDEVCALPGNEAPFVFDDAALRYLMASIRRKNTGLFEYANKKFFLTERGHKLFKSLRSYMEEIREDEGYTICGPTNGFGLLLTYSLGSGIAHVTHTSTKGDYKVSLRSLTAKYVRDSCKVTIGDTELQLLQNLIDKFKTDLASA